MEENSITTNEALRQVLRPPRKEITLPSPLDSVKREDFDSDAAYLEAAADIAVKRKSAEFVQAYNQVSIEQQRREMEKAREAAAKAIGEALKAVKIDQREIDDINKQATEWAQAELRTGRLDPRKLQEGVSAYVSRETEKLRKRKAEALVLSNAIRSAFGRGGAE